MNKPVLSIGIITCNQGRFIEKAIQSLLAQKTSYEYEIIICDDASEDDTAEIIDSLSSKPTRPIQFIRNEKRLGPIFNGKNFFDQARGKYLCYLEADDYWINENKIQTQTDFLEVNPDYVGCFHDAEIISDIIISEQTPGQLLEQTHGIWKYYSQFNKYTPDMYPWDILQRKIVPTASLLFRNILSEDFFERFSGNKLSISWALHLELIKNSKFRYFNEPWSVYLDHEDGFSKSIDLLSYKLNNIDILQKFSKDDYYKTIIKDVYKAIANEYYFLLHCNEAKKLDKKQYKYYCSEYKKWTERSLKTEIKSFRIHHNQPGGMKSCAE
ncbi:MAG TPA: glycosyltransferase family 2 protein [Bacteroidales bacterium]|nr:glycosyltransferase family 2 protein [Bacteroidales bacterium]